MKNNFNMFSYLDYRKLLNDIFVALKLENKNYSHRYFAQKAGFKTSSFLKLLIDGKRNLTEDSINKISKGFNFTDEERNYFKLLVYYNQSQNIDDKNSYYQKMINTKGFVKTYKLSREQYEYFSKWYHCVIRELCIMKNGKLKPEDMAKALEPKVTVYEVKESLKLLESLELIKKNSAGKYIQTSDFISTGLEVDFCLIANHHKEMIRNALLSLNNFKANERDITSVTFSLSKEKYSLIKEKIKNLRKDIIKLSCDEKNADTVYQINFQLFPLIKNLK